MAFVTLRVIDGPDLGHIWADLQTPFTVGREEGNTVQLNDDRVSRFHLKIQEDNGKLVVTDLESTNGTKLNGETIHLGVVRPGDLVAVGRTLLLAGSREQIAARLATGRADETVHGVPLESEEVEQINRALRDLELGGADHSVTRPGIHFRVPPALPSQLSPGQAAQLAELLQYLHLRIRGVLEGVAIKNRTGRVVFEQRDWQRLLDLQDRLAQYLRSVGEPDVS